MLEEPMRFPVARRGLPRGLALLAAVAAALPAAPAMAANRQVQVTDNAFVTPGVAVAPGESVTWTYASGGDIHNVSFEDLVPTTPPIGSPRSAPWTTLRTFPAAGEFRYFCEEHGGPGGQGMSGIVHVNAGAAIPGNAPTASFTASSALITVGQAVSRAGATLNSLRFSGRVGGRKLAPARYRMRAVAKDAAGNTSTARTATFRIR